MRQTTFSAHPGFHFPIAETLWVLAGIILILAYGDALVLSALALAIVWMTTAWWIHHRAAHGVQRNNAELASVTHLSRASTSRRDLKNTSAHANWRGPSAA